MIRPTAMLCALSLALLAGCGSDDDAAASDERSDDETDEHDTDTETEPEQRELVSYDLAEGDEDWEGWTIKAAEGLDVMGDLSGPRLTEDGLDDVWDLLVIKDTHRDLEEQKENLASEAEQDDERSIEYIEDEDDHLLWSSQYGPIESFNFIRNLVIDDTKVVCQTNLQMGADSEAIARAQMEACDTLTAPAVDADDED